jgi:hypothetical protein
MNNFTIPFEFFTHIVHFRPFSHDLQVSIAGATINEIDNHLDQVSAPPLLFISSGLNFQFSPHFLSFRGCNIQIRVYASYSLSGRIYGDMYAGKSNPSHVYVALHMTVNTATHVQVRKQVF